MDPEGLWESREGEACCGMVGSYAVPVSTRMSKLSVWRCLGSQQEGGDSWGMEYQPRTPEETDPITPTGLKH